MSKVWLFELYNEDEEVVYSSLIDDVSGENRILHAVESWPDKFVVESFFLFDAEEEAIRWSGNTMNTEYFIDDLRVELALAKDSIPSLGNATENFDHHEFTLDSFRKLERCGDLLGKLREYFPELCLPFKPTADEIAALKLVADHAVESSREEYGWHEYPNIPEPDRSYVKNLEELLSAALSKMQAGEMEDSEELQAEIIGLVGYCDDSYENRYEDYGKDDFYDIEGILAAKSIPRYLSERRAGIQSQNYVSDDLLIPAALDKLSNHPDSCFLANCFRAHASVPAEKVRRFELVIEKFPDLVRKFENASYRQRHWIYRAFDEEGALLYIGQTSTPLLRLRQHAGLDTKAQRLFGSDSRRRVVSEWFPKLARIEWQPFSNPIEARAAEAAFIYAEAPAYNKTFNKKDNGHLPVDSRELIEPPSMEDPRNVDWEEFRPSRVRLPDGFGHDIS